jgi:metallo-beta-lactamase family protein
LVHGEENSIDGLAGAMASAGLARDHIVVPALDQGFDLEHRVGRWMAVLHAGAAEPARLGAEQAAASRDWHNDYAQTLLDMRAALRNAPDDRTRQQLLRQLRAVLGHSDRRD